jgi:protein phosphatase
MSGGQQGSVSGTAQGRKFHMQTDKAGYGRAYPNKVNEDAVMVAETKDGSTVLGVFDGVGGGGSGEIASDEAVKTLQRELAAGKPIDDAMRSINDGLKAARLAGKGNDEMGVVAIVGELKGDDLVIRHTGDSRAMVVNLRS